jgi:hypothetical protein
MNQMFKATTTRTGLITIIVCICLSTIVKSDPIHLKDNNNNNNQAADGVFYQNNDELMATNDDLSFDNVKGNSDGFVKILNEYIYSKQKAEYWENVIAHLLDRNGNQMADKRQTENKRKTYAALGFGKK